ncbi:MAG: low-specificity L-threonine aldolase [Caldilineaceae bacterium]|nr:low-specificity L-threonine aldolase [Caldilineaceae bacterium]HRJ42612.1 low-specificity L-threonine aldolase [Caldilineaceae bacterium]
MSTPTIDLRSDTVTRPTPAMLEAMAKAPVGDDVYGEDPTVNRLEAITAQMLGKEAAVFVSSGTMGNLISVLAHCGRGDEVILGDLAHIFLYEQGGSAALGGVHPRAVPTQPDGTLKLTDIENAIRGDNEHFPISRLLAVENTHNRCGGRPLSAEYMDAAGQLAHRHGLKFHVDGARLWNAAVALNISPERLAKEADSVSLCLSKGLGAPVGSVVVGDKEFIRKARRMRKAVGGGMRQAGVIAAAGIVAVTEMVERLADDHANARRLAEGLNRLEGISIDPESVLTDIVIFDLEREDITPANLSAGLRGHGVLLNPIGGKRLRAVTNYHISEADIDRTLGAFAAVLEAGEKATDQRVMTYG